MKSFQGEVFKC